MVVSKKTIFIASILSHIVYGSLPSQESWDDIVAQADALFLEGDDSLVQLKTSIGNGFLATVLPDSNELFVGGVFNGPAESEAEVSHRASIPSPLGFILSGESNSAAALSLRNASYYRYSDNMITCFYAHRSRPSTIVVDIEPKKVPMDDDDELSVSIESIPLWTSTVDLNINNITQLTINDQTVSLIIGTTKESEAPGMPFGDIVTVALVTSLPLPNTTLQLFFNASTMRQTLFSCVCTSLESSNPASAALQQFELVSSIDSHDLWVEHVGAWGDLWRSGVESDRYDAALAVNSSLYYLLSSTRDDHPFGLSPGGLASNAYNGHSFWDCETWMFPSLALLQPSLAQSLLQYRVNRIPAALTKAASYDPPYSGAMFPWESAASGVETCPTSAATGQLEQHISGDIVFAAKTFYYVTKNETWLAQQGYDISFGVATWLSSRVAFDDDGVAHIYDVIPPDEYAEGDDSIYTNFVSKQALSFALKAAQVAGQTPDPDWSNIADSLLILEPGSDLNGATPEYSEYTGAEIKQADVVLLGFPLDFNLSTNQRLTDLDYYASLTDPDGPAMTWAMHAVGYLELNNGTSPLDPQGKIAGLFNQSFANVQSPWAVWTETPTGGATNFITGAGGFLQGVLFGFSGLRLTEESLKFNTPTLLPSSSYYRARGVCWRAGLFNFLIQQEEDLSVVFVIEFISSSSSSFEVVAVEEVGGSTSELSVGESVLFALEEGSQFVLTQN